MIGDQHILVDYISTHSLTRRLTGSFTFDLILIDISTHSLTRRLTGKIVNHTDNEIISTHSLTRRLTQVRHLYHIWSMYFNSQPHKEADKMFNDNELLWLLFQLTASQGG